MDFDGIRSHDDSWRTWLSMKDYENLNWIHPESCIKPKQVTEKKKHSTTFFYNSYRNIRRFKPQQS